MSLETKKDKIKFPIIRKSIFISFWDINEEKEKSRSSDGQEKMEGDEEDDKNQYFLRSELNYQNGDKSDPR